MPVGGGECHTPSLQVPHCLSYLLHVLCSLLCVSLKLTVTVEHQNRSILLARGHPVQCRAGQNMRCMSVHLQTTSHPHSLNTPLHQPVLMLLVQRLQILQRHCPLLDHMSRSHDHMSRSHDHMSRSHDHMSSRYKLHDITSLDVGVQLCTDLWPISFMKPFQADLHSGERGGNILHTYHRQRSPLSCALSCPPLTSTWGLVRR